MGGHIWEGRCPDEVAGFGSRDPECPACWQMVADESLSTLIRQRCEWWDRWRPSAQAFEVTGDILSILDRYDGG